MKKKLVSVLLVLSLVLGSVAGTALATDSPAGGTEGGTIEGDENGSSGIDDLNGGSSDNSQDESGGAQTGTGDTQIGNDPQEGSDGTSTGSDNTDITDPTTPDGPSEDPQEEEPVYHVRYRAHVQGIGWQNYVQDGELAGTTGQSRRMEALNIEIVKEVKQEDGSITMEPVKNAIEYCAHVQTIAWQNYVQDGAMIGTSGQSKRVEAFRLRLIGEVAEKYDIYYRTHIQTYATLDWAKNDEIAGSTGLSKRMETMEIRLVKKGDPAPGKTAHPFYAPDCKGDITYQTHVQTYGWMDSVADGATGGTSGQSKRMEALRLWVHVKDENGDTIPGGIESSVHVQGIGWMPYVSGGQLCGTSGEARRLEGIKIRLTGKLAELYHVYYRVHAQTFGTLGWAHDDAMAGTEALSKRLEFVEIRLVKKSDTSTIAKLEASGVSAVSPDMIGGLTAGFYDPASKNWDNASGTRITIGASGISRVNEALKASVITGSGLFDGGIKYEAHLAKLGWVASGQNGSVSGLPDGGNTLQAVKLSLTGDLAQYCDIYYRAHIQAYGWIGWAKNGQIAGSTGCDYRLEALEICIILKGATPPGENFNYHKTVKKGSKMIALTFDDGPGARTMELLNCLQRYDAHATFFVLGSNIGRYSSCLSKAVSIGCEVGNHSYSHATLTALSASGIQSEMSRTNDLIRQYTGSRAPVMRPPGGANSPAMRSAVGMPVILWSIDTLDWKTKNTASTVNCVLSQARDGDIVLMHDIHSPTINAALQLIPALIDRGFQLVTVSELAEAKGYHMVNGGVYSSFR